MFKSILIVLVAFVGLAATASPATARTKFFADLYAGDSRVGDAVYVEEPYRDGYVLQMLELKCQARAGELVYIYVDGVAVAKVTADSDGVAYCSIRSVRREGADGGRIPKIRKGSVIKIGAAHGFFEPR